MHEYLIVASVAVTLVQGEPVEKVSADELADRLDAANVLLNRDFETTFDYRVLRADPLEDGSPRGAEDWEFFETFRYVALGDKLYILRVVYERLDGPGATPEAKVRQENIWGDGAWAHRIEDENAVSFYAQARPTDLQTKGFIFNLMEGRYPSPTLADLVRTGTVLDQSVEDGMLTYRFAADDKPALRVQYTIDAQLEPSFALLGYTIEVSDSDPEDPQRRGVLRQAYSVLEWHEVGGLRIPGIAQIENFRSVDRSESLRLTSRTVYTRQSFREIGENDIDRGLFAVPLPIGTSVYDDRFKLSFQIGHRHLVLDGTAYELDDPVMEHPGDRLGEMIRQAKPYYPPDGSSSPPRGAPDPAAPLQSTSVLRSPIVLAGLVAAAAALLTVAVIRARRPAA